jgi:hypothetical protein
MATVESIIKELSAYDPKEHLLVLYWDKELCKEWVEETLTELKDEHNLTDKEVNEAFNESWEYATEQQYDTPDIGDGITQSLMEALDEWSKEQSEATYDEQLDKQLWDKE